MRRAANTLSVNANLSKQAAWVLCLACASACVSARGTLGTPRDVSDLVTLEADAIVVRETISFPLGKADIDPRSLDLLDAVAAIMKSTGSIAKLTIEGHTDPTGDPDFNRPLSEARALAVKQYLEGKGVDPARLDAKGFGSDQPIASNDTEEGRAKNRRVEFKVSR